MRAYLYRYFVRKHANLLLFADTGGATLFFTLRMHKPYLCLDAAQREAKSRCTALMCCISVLRSHL